MALACGADGLEVLRNEVNHCFSLVQADIVQRLDEHAAANHPTPSLRAKNARFRIIFARRQGVRKGRVDFCPQTQRLLTSRKTQFQPRQVVDRLAAPILGLPQDSLGLDAKLYERAVERRLMRVAASHR